MRFRSLGSGSKGNATLVAAGDQLLLIDCGFSVRELSRRMAACGLAPQQLDAILITHEHSDHCAGAAALSRKFDIPLYLTHGTLASGRVDGGYQLHCFNSDQPFAIGDVDIFPVAVPHDAREPCQYRFSHGDFRLGIVTDLGSVTPHVVSQFSACDALMLEFNHDLDMLLSGPYPPMLKRRVAGDWGHLNNDQAASLLQALDSPRLRHVVISHISENNNATHLVEQVLDGLQGIPAKTVWANQALGCDWLQL